MLLRILSPDGRLWALAFLAAMLLILLLEEDWLPGARWTRRLLLATFAFASLGLLVDAALRPRDDARVVRR